MQKYLDIITVNYVLENNFSVDVMDCVEWSRTEMVRSGDSLSF